MKAVTKIPVTYNVPNKVNEQEQNLVECRLLDVSIYPSVRVLYQYNVKDGVLLKSDSKAIDNATADAILGQSPINSVENGATLFYNVLRQEMATTFGISVNDIEIVD
jgi:hypothetical protein